MLANQLTVFIENRTGRLGQVLGVLKEHQVNILSMSLADTTEYGLLRLIVDEPQRGRDTLKAEGFAAHMSQVFIIRIPHTAGSLQKLLKVIEEADVGIEYMYGLSFEAEQAHVVMKVSHPEKTEVLFSELGVETITGEHLAGM